MKEYSFPKKNKIIYVICIDDSRTTMCKAVEISNSNELLCCSFAKPSPTCMFLRR